MYRVLVFLIIIQPLLHKLGLKFGWSFDIYNELISICVFFAFIYRLLLKRKITNFFIIPLLIILYLVLLSFFKNNYLLSYFQIVLYSQFFFYFFYFYSFNQEEKMRMITALKKLFDALLIFIIILSFIELGFSDQFRSFMNVHSHNRGIGKFYLVSFFGSGPSLANFISLYVFIWHCYYYGFGNKVTSKAKTLMFFSVIICILSFSRKEVFLTLVFLIFFPYPAKTKVYTWVKRTVVLITVGTGLLIYYQAFFAKANAVASSSKYVRWQIVEYSKEILGDNLPFGTGAGTFGSQMSFKLNHIYEKYNVGPQMLGYKDLKKRGPIYDAFFFTFTTEIGIGILLFITFFFIIAKSNSLKKNNYLKFIKKYIIFYLFFISLFTPVLMNSFGFLIAIVLALLSMNINILKLKKNNVQA